MAAKPRTSLQGNQPYCGESADRKQIYIYIAQFAFYIYIPFLKKNKKTSVSCSGGRHASSISEL